MRIRTLALLGVLCAPISAWAACNPFPILDGAGASTNFASVTNGSSQCEVATYLTDATGANAYPSAAALSDTIANPTTIVLGSMNMLYNGSTWTRWAQAGTGVGKTDMTSIAGTATAVNTGAASAGTQRVVLSTDSALAANQSVNAAQMNGVAVTMGNGVSGTGVQRVTIASDSTGTINPGNTANTTPWLMQEAAGTTGGMSWFFLQPTAGSNATNIKNGAGQVYSAVVMNNSATVNYLRFYDAGTGFAGCNSATNLKGQFQIPAAATGSQVGGFVIPIPLGAVFSTGISICVTAGYGTNDTTAATASAMSVNVFYK